MSPLELTGSPRALGRYVREPRTLVAATTRRRERRRIIFGDCRVGRQYIPAGEEWHKSIFVNYPIPSCRNFRKW